MEFLVAGALACSPARGGLPGLFGQPVFNGNPPPSGTSPGALDVAFEQASPLHEMKSRVTSKTKVGERRK